MEREGPYRDKANRARRLAEASWQPELKDENYDEIAEDIETRATEIRHRELRTGNHSRSPRPAGLPSGFGRTVFTLLGV
jgi:hypothetical protein